MKVYGRIILIMISCTAILTAQQQRLTKADIPAWFNKQASAADRKYFLMNGNQIVGNIYNYGGIAPGLGLLRHVNNMVWHGLGDIYQFCPLVAASVIDSSGKVVAISSDAVNDVYAKDVDQNDNSVIYGWEPLPDYADPSSPVMASSGAPDISPRDGKPDSWPSSWYNPSKGQYVWPGYLRQDVPNADLEVLWGMDDRDNSEFAYFPFYKDTVASDGRHLRGLGVKVEGRALQWSNALAQNTIFFVYTVQNYSTRDLDTVYFGMYGDVDVGGGYPINTAESQDDLGFFISPLDTVDRLTGKPVAVFSRSLVYFWDNDGVGNYGLRTHYDACKFLESPGNPNDGIDNDGDGMIDESQTNGIDDDHDWKATNDDVGIDGVPDTHDPGEGDGVPTAGIRLPDGTLDPLHPGEPNFELTDLDESDQIGLTAFRSWTWGADPVNNLSTDSLVWQHLEEGFYNTIPQVTDISFLYGSGKISLKKRDTDGSIKRFSIALLMGENKDDILLTAQTVQVIYNQNYQFIRPPDKPIVTAVAGDRKATLYWDSEAENSVDPIQGKDFEGYVIYRSTDPQFSDINQITDGKGTSLLAQPLQDSKGRDAKWDIATRPEPFADSGSAGAVYDNTIKKWYKDLNGNGKWDASVDDYWKGYAPKAYDGRGVSYYLGDNTGLVHSYVDSNNVINGQTYYYAVVSYDHGDSVQYPPSECTKRISIDPITSRMTFDVNTVAVIPGPRSSGYTPPGFASAEGADHIQGSATGRITLQILNDMAISGDAQYGITFADSLQTDTKKIAAVNYSVLRLDPVTSQVYLFDTNYVKIGRTNVSVDSFFVVSDAQSNQVFAMNTDYVLDPVRGLLRKTGSGAMKNKTGPFNVTYRFFGQPPSTLINNEEANPVFDGIKVFAQNQPLALDTINSTWVNDNNKTIDYHVGLPTIGTIKVAPFDVQIFFYSSDTLANGMYAYGDTLPNTINKPVITPFHIVNVTKDSIRANIKITARILESKPTVVKGAKDGRWDFGEPIIFVTPPPYGSGNNTMYQVTFSAKDSLNKKFGGEIFRIVTQQPFTSKDVYQFQTVAAKFDAAKASGTLDRIKVVPNPYVAVNDIEPTDRLPGTTRGSRRIYFEHLPPRATIRIFTLSGELVRTLEHDSGIDNGREYWDLLNRDNLGVAYGVYIAHIDAPGVGQRIVKFALIK